MRILGEKQSSVGIYVHIPFCSSKCLYCDFTSFETIRIPEKKYIYTLLGELDLLLRKEGVAQKSLVLESIYLGGGTPSLFTPSSIGALIDGVKKHFVEPERMEVTLEANPETLGLEKLKGYRRAGVNRLSMGVQSLNDGELKRLGRIHGAQKAIEAVLEAGKAGFENIGVDLIFGLPGQKPKVWLESVLKAIELRPQHLSTYGLTIEEGTPFHDSLSRGELALPTEDEELEMYSSASELLKGAGYGHYEISNFSLCGLECRQNLRYWQGGDYLGLGAGAHSYFNSPGWGRRWWNEPDPYEYMRRVESQGSAAKGCEELTKDKAMLESVFLSLRMLSKGIKAGEFKRRFEVAPREALDVERLERQGLIRSDGDEILLTPRGILLSNEVFSS